MDSNEQQVNKDEWVITKGTQIQEGKVEPIQEPVIKERESERTRGANLRKLILEALESSDEDEDKFRGKRTKLGTRENKNKKKGRRMSDKKEDISKQHFRRRIQPKTLFYDKKEEKLVFRILDSDDEEDRKILEQL
jgi:hypothetical protein